MVEVAILALIFILSLYLIHKNFELSIKLLLVLSVFLHKEVFSIYRWDFLPARFFMLALSAYFGTKAFIWLSKKGNLKKSFSYLKNPFYLLLGLIWLVRLFSIYFTKNLQASILLFGFFTTVVIFGIVLYNLYYKHPYKIINLLKLYIYIVFGLCLFGYFQLGLYLKTDVIIGALWNVPGHTPRIGSTFWDVNHFAALLAVLLPVLGVFILIEKSKKIKVAYSFMFLIMTSILYLTSSRTSWIIAFVSFVLFISILLVKKFGKKGIVGLVLAFLLITIPAVVEYTDRSSPFRAAIRQNFHYRLDSFASHFMLLVGTYQIFEEYPVLGGGYGSFFEHFRKTDISSTFFGRDPAALNTRVPAHTIWGELISETGILGTLVFIPFILLMLAPLFYSALRNKDKQISLISAAMFSALVGIYTAGIFYSYNSEFFWIILFLYFIFGVSTLPPNKSLTDVFGKFLNSSKLWLLILVLISAGLIFINLGSTHLIPWDEAIYAKISKNMVVRNDFLEMQWQPNNIWFEKPPLGLWTQALFMKLIGFISFAARLPSAIFGFLTIFLVYFLTKKLFNSVAAFIASLSLLTTIHFLQYSRYAMLDVTLAFFMTGGIYFYYLAKTKNNKLNHIFSGVFIGLGIMTKGAVGFLPFGVIGINELYLIFSKQQEYSKELLKNWITIFVSSLVIFMPWHIYMYITYKSEFINTYLIYHVFDRATAAIEDKGQPLNWYLVVLRVSMRIWYVALLVSFPYTLYKVYKKSKKHTLLLIWSLLIFVFFSIAKSKIVWYIIPIYPVLAIIIGNFAADFIFYLRNKYFNSILFIPITLYVIFIASIGYLFYERELVYTSDLTGSKARLLQLKDQEFQKEDRLYVHAIEEPLILYYTDGSFSGYDIHIEKGRIPLVTYDQKLIILAKRGRFPGEDFILNGKETNVVGEDGDYVLWYYKSDLDLDRRALEDIEKQISQTNPSFTEVLQRLNTQKQEIEARMAPFID